MKFVFVLKRYADRFNKECDPRIWFWGLVATAAAILVLAAALIFAIDPLMHYRYPSFYQPVFDSAREQLPGMLRHYPGYDTILVGNSLSQNYKISEINTNFSADALKVTASGLTAREGRELLEVAERSRKQGLKKVIWCLDILGFRVNQQSAVSDETAYLRQGSHIADHRYWWNLTIWDEFVPPALQAIFIPRTEERKRRDFDQMFSWDDDNFKGGMAVIVRNKTHRNVIPSFDWAMMKHSFEQNFLELTRKNPELEFVFLFSPYNIIFWEMLRERPEDYRQYFELKEYMVQTLLHCQNVKIFDFQALEESVTDCGSFRDITHFSPALNSRLLTAIGKGEFRVQTLRDAAGREQLDSLLRKHPEIYAEYRRLAK